MIDITELQGAVKWLERGLAAFAEQPETQLLQDGLLHSVEVTYNVAERFLRLTLAEVTDDESLALLSSRELMRYAADEGLALASAERWLNYGLAMERASQDPFGPAAAQLVTLIPQYLRELQSFVMRLEARLVPVG